MSMLHTLATWLSLYYLTFYFFYFVCGTLLKTSLPIPSLLCGVTPYVDILGEVVGPGHIIFTIMSIVK